MLHPLPIMSTVTGSRYTQRYLSSSQFVTGTALHFTWIFITIYVAHASILVSLMTFTALTFDDFDVSGHKV